MDQEKFCQSCSMPLEDESLLGTEKDGSKSHDYCQYCYQSGEFTHPELTLEKMINRMSNRMDKKHLPEEIIEAAISRLPKLKRWERNNLTS